MKLGWPLPKRRAFLKKLSEEDSARTHLVPFRGKQTYMPIRSVPLDLPLYRLENGRTMDRQAEYLAKHPDLPQNFFRVDTEAHDAQLAQHSMLQKLAVERKNLLNEFRKSAQTEAIVLSHLGYVVNGNRRLCAWRVLYEEDPAKYRRFQNIDVVVLPFCDEKDLDVVEAELQLKEDLKADYSWTAKALMIREKQTSSVYGEKELAHVYDMKLREMRELLDSLDYADAYLESRGKDKIYSLVDLKQYAFRQISRSRSKMKQSEASKEVFERVGFCLVDEVGEGERVYAEISKTSQHIDQVIDTLCSEFDINVKSRKSNAGLLKLSDALYDVENFESARLVVRDTIEAEDSKKRRKTKFDYASVQIDRARKCLEDAVDSIEKKSTREGVSANLDKISKLVKTLKTWASNE